MKQTGSTTVIRHVQSIIQHAYKNIFTVTHTKEKYEHLTGLNATNFKSTVMKTLTFYLYLLADDVF